MRKQPRQRRSRRMVDALIDATAQCITQYGVDGTTTPRIAECAGVSVGSLYQYFSDKDALFEALGEKLAHDVARALKRLPLPESANLHDLVGGAIRFGFDMLNAREGLFLELIRNWHRLPTARVADVLQGHFLELARLYFIKHHQKYPIEDLQVRMFIVANSTLFTMVRQVSQDEGLLRQEDVAEGLTNMIVGYLGGETGPSR